MMKTPIIYIGYDPAEHDAYIVARHTIEKHASGPVVIKPLVQPELRHMGLYSRTHTVDANGDVIDSQDMKPFSTQFTFTRFLVPFLTGRHGWAIFMDCDMMIREDIYKLWDLRDDKYAVMCVKHQHVPDDGRKMFNQVQTRYSRKNWSSVMMINCGHERHRDLSLGDVNTRSGSWLHNFSWCNGEAEKYIGEIPEAWNWLDGHSSSDIDPSNVHMTRGGPWIPEWQEVAFADEWRVYFDEIEQADREWI
tara:strand:- start:49 stop:795 length:747 start_codon:yes stop_codon:yes gene_type:complete